MSKLKALYCLPFWIPFFLFHIPKIFRFAKSTVDENYDNEDFSISINSIKKLVDFDNFIESRLYRTRYIVAASFWLFLNQLR